MAGTAFSSLIAQARLILAEPVANFWSDAELLGYAQGAVTDLWRRIIDTYEDYFVTIDDTNVSLALNTAQFTGVPADCHRVVTIEPRTIGSQSSNRGLIFKNKRYNDPAFIQARAADPVNPSSTIVYYALMQQGAPVAAPIILCAPQVTATVLCRLVYNQILARITNTGGGSPPATDFNPIPGDADTAIIAWMVAYARGKEADAAQRSPDPEWLAVYSTEKNNLINQLDQQRSTQDQEVADALFEDAWPDLL
jgi:hypothetical protein